jgi:hypothetical protein
VTGHTLRRRGDPLVSDADLRCRRQRNGSATPCYDGDRPDETSRGGPDAWPDRVNDRRPTPVPAQQRLPQRAGSDPRDISRDCRAEVQQNACNRWSSVGPKTPGGGQCAPAVVTYLPRALFIATRPFLASTDVCTCGLPDAGERGARTGDACRVTRGQGNHGNGGGLSASGRIVTQGSKPATLRAHAMVKREAPAALRSKRSSGGGAASLEGPRDPGR